MDNLYRSRDDQVIAGVCAGLAHRFDFNKNGLRWLMVLITLFFNIIPVIVYVVLWCILKERDTTNVVNA